MGPEQSGQRRRRHRVYLRDRRMEIMQGMEFVSQDKEIKFYFKFDYKLLQFFFFSKSNMI